MRRRRLVGVPKGVSDVDIARLRGVRGAGTLGGLCLGDERLRGAEGVGGRIIWCGVRGVVGVTILRGVRGQAFLAPGVMDSVCGKEVQVPGGGVRQRGADLWVLVPSNLWDASSASSQSPEAVEANDGGIFRADEMIGL